jgi:hypothetical protein
VPVKESIGNGVLSLFEAYALGQRLRVADVLIAATTREAAGPLATCNARHFRAIAGLELRVFRPQAELNPVPQLGAPTYVARIDCHATSVVVAKTFVAVLRNRER